jgi:hypothetical protein
LRPPLYFLKNGIFSVIVPYKEEKRFLDLANEYELYPLKLLTLRERQLQKPNAVYWLLAELKLVLSPQMN